MNVKGYDINDKEGYKYHHQIWNSVHDDMDEWCYHIREIEDELDNSKEMWDEYDFYWICHEISNDLFQFGQNESKEFRSWSIDLIRNVMNQINEKKEEIEGKKKKIREESERLMNEVESNIS